MPAKLHINGAAFDLPAEADFADITQLLLTAFQDNKATTVQVHADGKPLLLIINPAQIPYLALDQDGTWIGFHSGAVHP